MALDLFCGAGGAAYGLRCAGFCVLGVDVNPQPRYAGCRFIQGDALAQDLTGYDFVWASPPCQGYSHLTPVANRGDHAKLIPAVRELLEASGKPWVIENVQGARHELRNPVMLCGSMFGLRTRRHRWFECSFTLTAPKPCDHHEMPLLVTTASKASRAKRHALGMKPKTVANAPAAYGVDWMTCDGLKECIPPAYTEWIGREFLKANASAEARRERTP